MVVTGIRRRGQTLVSSLMVPRSTGYFSLATIGDKRSRAASEGRAGASREKVSSAAWLTWEEGEEEEEEEEERGRREEEERRRWRRRRRGRRGGGGRRRRGGGGREGEGGVLTVIQ